MSRWRPAVEGDPVLDDAVPTVLSAGDPWGGDDHLLAAASHANHLRHCPLPEPLSEAEHAALDDQFRDAYCAILSGTAPWPSIQPVVAALGLDGPIQEDRRPAPAACFPLADDVLAEICEDFIPDIGVICPDRVLGPMSTHTLPRSIHVLAGAVMSFAPLLRGGVVPLSRTVVQRPRPAPDTAAAIRAAARTPPMLWSVQENDLRAELPLSSRRHPTAPIVGQMPGQAMIARAVPHADGGTWLSAILPLPTCPDPAIVQRRMMLEMWRLRRHDIRITWEDVLRTRGEVLYRTACEWCWWHCPTETLALWRSLR